MIDKYHKDPKEEALIEQSRLNSIQMIEKRFKQSETNKKYIYPRKQEMMKTEADVPKQPLQSNFQDLLQKIYLNNARKQEVKQKYAAMQKQSTQKTLQLSLSQNRLFTESKFSRGTSPTPAKMLTSRSISTQLMKYIAQQKVKATSPARRQVAYQICRSFEMRDQLNRSPQLMTNKSLDFSKNMSKLK